MFDLECSSCRVSRRRVAPTAMLLVMVMFWAAVAQASEVRVFKPVEAGVNPSDQRQQTLQLGFEEAVFQTALKLLPAQLSESRAVVLREHLDSVADSYVLGYKEVVTTPSSEGLTMVVDVDVNRRALREALERMGLFHTVGTTLNVNLIAESTLTQEDLETLSKLRVLTGVAPAYTPLPEMRIGREPDGPVRGILHTASGNWSALDTDIRTVWFHLWERYFVSASATSSGSRSEVLSVNGWFTSDGANEFDNMLRTWEGELRDVRLIDMDLATEGVTARWEVGIINRGALVSKLETYLPSRGLSYRLSGTSD